MKTTTWLAVKSPNEFYFIEAPIDGKSNLPGSMDYKFYNLTKFISKLIGKYPGTIRDLGGATNIRPEFLFRFSSVSTIPAIPVNVCFAKIVTYESVHELIKLYYTYVLATDLF